MYDGPFVKERNVMTTILLLFERKFQVPKIGKGCNNENV